MYKAREKIHTNSIYLTPPDDGRFIDGTETAALKRGVQTSDTNQNDPNYNAVFLAAHVVGSDPQTREKKRGSPLVDPEK